MEGTEAARRESNTELTGAESWEWFATPADEVATCTDGTANVTVTQD